MKVMKLVVFAVLAICVASCGGKKGSNDSEQIIVKPIETTVSGDMEGCFTVVDKEYKTTGAWANGIITVELERTDQELPFELNGRELLPFRHLMHLQMYKWDLVLNSLMQTGI